jgi:amino acid adenylation domain-containing protein
MGAPSTFVDLLQLRALQEPDRILYRFLADGEVETSSLSLADLDKRARSIAAWLQVRGLQDTRALLLYPSGLDFIAAFFGCLYADVVAVPLHPPHSTRSLSKLNAIMKETQPRAILTCNAFRERVTRWLKSSQDDRSHQVLATDEVASDLGGQWQIPSIGGDTLAFLQYTSGSTAAPKGVMVTHRNLLHTEGLIQSAFHQTESSIVVGWLPLYHDMGLIGNLLQPLFTGARCILMPPTAFLQNPLRWLQCISRYRATTSGGPNFAYELCLRKIGRQARASLDLSSWDVAFNGSETVRVETLRRFGEAFESCGFRHQAFYPCYGLAEATLLVAGGSRSEEADTRLKQARAIRTSRPLASSTPKPMLAGCGEIFDSTRVAVVDPQTLKQCAPGQAGELWVSGLGVAAGYWDRPDETERVFRAYLAETGEGPFLRTGDLGFLRGRELFITGRLKELIIIRGRNYYPQDIELTAEHSHPSLPVRSGAALSVEVEGEERLVLVQELAHNHEIDAAGVAMAIRRAVAEQYELGIHEIVFIRSGSISKTSSGKIQRHICRELYLSRDLRVSARSPFASDGSGWNSKSLSREAVMCEARADRWPVVEAHLRRLVAQVLSVSEERIECDRPLISLGLDSLMATELKHTLEEELEITLSFSELLGGDTIATITRDVLLQINDGQPRSAFAPLPSADDLPSRPLSYGQRSLWFLQGLAPDSGAYNIAFAARIRGRMNVDALRSAFQRLIERHRSLRTVFVVRDDTVQPLIKEPSQIYFEVVDATSWSESVLNERLAEESHRTFDLERGPLIRVGLFERNGEERIALLVMHHIIADFRSLEVMVEELATTYRFYANDSSDGPPTLAPLVAEYAAYVNWQERLTMGLEGEQHLEFWRSRLEGELPELNLPADRPRPPVQTFRGASTSVDLNPTITEQARALGRACGATPYMVFLAAFYVLMLRNTGQEDVVVGSPTNGRSLTEFTNLVGYCVNQVALRADLSGNPTFVEFLDRVRRLVLDAFVHKDYPFALLVERLQPSRSASHSPVFQAMFVLQQAARPEAENLAAFALGRSGARLKFDTLDVESLAIEQRAAQFDVTLSLAITQAGTIATLQYNTDLFEATTSARMLEHYTNLLESILAVPDHPIASLPMISEAQQHQLTVEWNDTIRDYPPMLLHELFEAQVDRTPDAVAVIFGDESLTYRYLNASANKLAHHLRSMNVGPETLVGVFMKRSLEMLIGLIATLKAGGAYAALDPSHPEERTEFMLQDAQISVLLTQDCMLARLPPSDVRVLCLNTEWRRIATESSENPPRGAATENLAYIIYTSGSTGHPKGVCIEHRSAGTLVQWAADAFSSGELDRVFASTSICFDLSVFELFAPLSYGGTIILAENALELSVLPAAPQITLINTVPSAIAELVRGGRLPASVRTVNLAGEPFSRGLVGRLLSNSSVDRVLNLYGPSEDTTYSTFAVIAAESGSPPPIGRPIANTQVYVLDGERLQEPIGVPGELCLGGEGLSRGYLRRPELTAERFIPHPLSDVPGARLYRTGDLARYLADGQAEFMGRLDQQIKLRGFRIELGEIEAVLRGHAAVTEAIVISSAGPANEPRLVAYVVLSGERRASVAELRAHARSKLPYYMIPASFVVLDDLPLTRNGKIDRGALPPPDWSESSTTESFAAPRNPVEEILAGIFAELLGLDQVGVSDNFFALGGYSLLAARLAARVQSVFMVNLPLASVFEAPCVASLAEHIEASLRAGVWCAAESLQRVARDEPLPLSFAQQRLWFLEQLDTRASSYNIPLAIHLTGPMNVVALKQSFEEIVRRHEALRTNFIETDGQPIQIIAACQSVCLSLIDLSEISEGEKETAAEQIAIAEGRLPFDLAGAPLLRLRVIKQGTDDHLLLLTIHHMVSDEWSLRILARELGTLYELFCAGRRSVLPELPFQYVDYTMWQRRWLQEGRLDEQRSFWKQRLADSPSALNLPVDRPRSPVASFRGATVARFFHEFWLSKLQRLSQQHSATLFMTLLAAFKVLLYRYTDQHDILVCTPVATRAQGGVEDLIGCFINMLPLRTDISAELTFEEFLSRVREASLSGYSHQDLPFEMMVRDLQPGLGVSRNTSFQVMFAFQGETLDLGLSGLNPEVLTFDYGVAKCELTLLVEVKKRGFVVSLEYSTDLFEPPTIIRMLNHYANLLKAIADHPGRRLSALQLLDEAERHSQLVDWNSTRSDYPRQSCLHEQFEEQVARTPEAVALVFGDEHLSYRELNERANKAARYLQRCGVECEARVGVLMERSLEMIWAVLGVLKAGGAYVPLDVTNPGLRVREMIEDAGADVVLTETKWAEVLEGAGLKLVRVDGAERDELERERGEPVSSRVEAGNLAYVIYTSGSTGKPKGVMVSHRALVNHSFAVACRYCLGPADRVLQFASLSFDVAAEELFPSLQSGCCIVLRPFKDVPSLPPLLDYVSEELVTVLNLPASYWHEWVSEFALTVPLAPSLRLLVVGSERASAERMAAWRRMAGDRVTWLNAYGTTETTITSTIYRPPNGQLQSNASSMSIGRPIGNTQAYLLDRESQLVPLRIPGELFIGGDGLARGYLNDPVLTACKFVPDPYSDDTGARMYRTGDLARYLDQGDLEFLGRRDEQVKVSGFRVEPGEVEMALQQHPKVRQAAAVIKESPAGDKRLVAYLVAARSADISGGELREFLSGKLPEYMIPSAYVELESLPLTPNGKTDRRALSKRELEVVGRSASHAAPRTLVEEMLTGIWADVLGLERVGFDDSFFELGGHSLLAMRIVARVRQSLQVDVSLADFFTAPTVSRMTKVINGALRAERGIESLSIAAVDRRKPLPLSLPQLRLWFLDQLQPGSSTYNISGAIRLRGRLDVHALHSSLNEIVRRHEALRTTFAVNDGNPVQVIASELSLPLPLLDLRAVPEEDREDQVRNIITAEARRAFDLERGPLLRVLLAREDERSHVLALTMHHIVSDAWSLAALTEELAILYKAFSSGLQSPLAELRIQYADYAAWQQELLQGNALEAQRAYWRNQLGGELAQLRLPVDHPRPVTRSARGATQSFLLPDGFSESLNALSRREGVTLFMTLLAAFQAQIHRYSMQEDVRVGTDVACRDWPEIEGLIGFFVNTLVLRTDLSGDPTFAQLLGRVRKVTLDAFTHRDLPFHELVRELHPERNLGLTPLFQVMFILQNTPRPMFSLPGLSLTPLNVDDGSSVFDLSVSMEEDEQGRLGGTFRYSTDLFEHGTIARMIGHFINLLRSVLSEPGTRLSALEMFSAAELEERAMENKRTQSEKFKRLRATKPRSLSLSQNELVKSGYLKAGSVLPLVLQPAVDDVDLVAWAMRSRDFIEDNLFKHGAILFRGFKIESLGQFESFASVTSNQLITYGERSSPRTALGGYVYTSTDHPAGQNILLHNEQSYTLEWPMKIWFFCQQPASSRGATPLADSRKIADRLSDVTERFAKQHVMYVRNYGDRLGLPWEEAFQTRDRAAVEVYCRKASIELEWKDRDRLRTRQVRAALRKHPRTGETVWFNHALFFHVSSLEESAHGSIMAGIREEELPYNTYYGDGSAIEPEVLRRIREAYRLETVSFAWQQGDILMVDNMLVAHGRESFEGERQIAVIMGDPLASQSSHSNAGGE